ncbi:MAG: hypothetical protein HYX96_04295 [Chloroflexi bacterium]|nr:hypothetical protein [Chloroflexota bacterium]
MNDDLKLIDELIRAHRGISQRVRSLESSVTDLEAVLDLQKAQSGWELDSKEALAQKQAALGETLGYLDAGLRRHFEYEEIKLPGLFSPLMMQWLKLEHARILEGIARAKESLVVSEAELAHEQRLSRKWDIQRMTSEISRDVEDHARKEEVTYEMIKTALTKTG